MATDHAAASQSHFARRATGFVRDVKVSDAVIFNVLPACPGLVMAVSIFWVLTAFSGVNVYACIVITAICSFLISGAFGLLSQIMPRSGADYILISRSLHPALAVGSSILIGASSMLAMGYWGVFTAKICIGPMLTMVGVAADSSTLQSWGGTIASKPWDMLVGFGEIALLALIMAYGMRFMMRVQFWLFALGMGGFVVAALTLPDDLAVELHQPLQHLCAALHAPARQLPLLHRPGEQGRHQPEHDHRLAQHDRGVGGVHRLRRVGLVLDQPGG